MQAQRPKICLSNSNNKSFTFHHILKIKFASAPRTTLHVNFSSGFEPFYDHTCDCALTAPPCQLSKDAVSSGGGNSEPSTRLLMGKFMFILSPVFPASSGPRSVSISFPALINLIHPRSINFSPAPPLPLVPSLPH